MSKPCTYNVTNDSSASSSSSSSSASSPSIDLYSNTIFSYLNDSNKLEYLALQDFTLRFPASLNDVSDPAQTNTPAGQLKHLYLRNIRNIKTLTRSQTMNLRAFLSVQFNLNTLDLVGLYLSSSFLCSIIKNLHNLKQVHPFLQK